MQARDKGLELLLRHRRRRARARGRRPDAPAARCCSTCVGNAVKFTERGEVVVAVVAPSSRRGDGDRSRFEVRDTGIGIRAEQRAALFQPFTQADSSTTAGSAAPGWASRSRSSWSS